MIKFQSEFKLKNEKDNLVIGIFSDVQHPIVGQVDKALYKHLGYLLKDNYVSTKFKDITPLYTFGQLDSKQIYFVGLGNSSEFTLEKSREVFGVIAKTVKEDVVILLDTFEFVSQSTSELAAVIAETITLATFKPATYKSEEKEQPVIHFNIHSQSLISEQIERGIIYGDATNKARQLVNEPGNKLTATVLANTVLEFASEHQLEAKIIEKDEMIELGMGGILGVNQGSCEPPKLIVAKYQGTSQFENITALVGKGLTFDTGGYCLKPGAGMALMKTDMGGAASAFGAFMIAVQLKLPINLLLVIPSTDNMISGDAIKPGDVIRTMSGKTIEVTNTDAEGRLILADGITFAKHLGANRIIDLATLTGAIVAALGANTTGVFTNNQEFLNNFAKATLQTNEDIWQMPIKARDHEALRCSDVADFDNSPKGKPGAIMAATFLKEFAENTPWIHLDIAGTAAAAADSHLGPKGGTGVMVRTIAKYLEQQQ